MAKKTAGRKPRATTDTETTDRLFRYRKGRSACINVNSRTGKRRVVTDPTLHVVLDAGHGGPDPGATVEDKQGNIIFEKDLTLAIVQRIVPLIPPEIEIHLTRRRDRSVSLADRVLRCSDYDLFVSIHCNAIAGSPAQKAKVRGSEVLIYSAKDELLKRLANHFLAHMTVGTEMPANQPNPIRSRPNLGVLRRAEARRDRYGRSPSILRPAVHSDTYGEKGKGVPAVLLELGYMTNKKDLALLRSTTYQQQVAKAIANALRALAPLTSDRLNPGASAPAETVDDNFEEDPALRQLLDPEGLSGLQE